MNIKTINGIEIFRPLDRAETDSYSKAKNNLFSKYDKGRITDSNKITRIMNTQFEHFEDILDQWLSILASRGFLEFLLYQYDQYSKVEQKFKDRELSSLDEEFWKEYGSLARRGIKYLIELLCHYQIEDVNPTISSNKLEYLTSIVFIAAEEMCNYYLSSDLTHSILPGKTVLVLDPAQHTYLDLKVIPEHEIVFDIRDDTSNRHRYVGERNILNDFPTHNNILGEAFVEAFGFDYSQGIGVLSYIIENAVPVQDGFPVYFINYDETVTKIAFELKSDFKKTKEFFEGFCVRLENMRKEGREIFKPKQEHRALKRGFFVYNHKSGEHLAFSKYMAQECLMYLTHEIVFKKIPPEWKTDNTIASLDKLSNKAGAWFEKKVFSNLKSLGMSGISSVKKLGLSNKQVLFVPDNVGEIDIIAYSEKDEAIIIVECKLLKPATEPKFFRDDLHQFLYSKKSFRNKFLKKNEWVLLNIDKVADALISNVNYFGRFATINLSGF